MHCTQAMANATPTSSFDEMTLSSTSDYEMQPDPLHETEDPDNFTCGDLGFGFCLKPGGIPVRKFNPNTLQYEDDLPNNSFTSKVLSFSDDGESFRKGEYRKLRSSSTPCLRTRDRLYSGHCSDDIGWESFPVLDGVHLGTSLRQQRALYAEKMKEYRDKKKLFTDCAINENSISVSSLELQPEGMPDSRHIQRKLIAATEEVEVLQCELEACKSQLDSKYRAIQILKSQSMLVNATQRRFVEASTVMKKSLEKEVNSLQFELDAKMSSLMLSEQTWAERFDRLCLENAALMATLQARSDELRKMNTEKMALIRERDELIARMDAKERLEYDKESSVAGSYDEECSLAQQLAVLGACACRGSKPEPCRCAKAAAKLKKESHQLMAEITRLSHELASAHLSADSFRLAFEDQLDHNSALGWQVAQDMNKKKKTIRQRFPWKRKAPNPTKEAAQNGDDNLLYDDSGGSIHEDSEEKDGGHDVRSIGVQASQQEPDLVGKLIELLNDRSQALAHQRLVAKMLARRAQDLEHTLSRLTKLSGNNEV